MFNIFITIFRLFFNVNYFYQICTSHEIENLKFYLFFEKYIEILNITIYLGMKVNYYAEIQN